MDKAEFRLLVSSGPNPIGGDFLTNQYAGYAQTPDGEWYTDSILSGTSSNFEHAHRFTGAMLWDYFGRMGCGGSGFVFVVKNYDW